MSFPATERQLGFIERLCTERHPNGKAAAIVMRQQRLTKDGAGKVIDALMAMPVLAQAPAADGTVDTRGSLPHNRFSGKCVLCKHEVPAQAGTYRKGTTVKWETLHLPGECPQEAAAAPVKRTWNEIIGDLPDGFYAVPSVTGTNDLSFFKVYTNKGTFDASKKGKRGIKQVVGGLGADGRVGTEWVEKATEAVRTLGVQECQGLYGQEMGQCGRCNRPLTDETSRKLGIGPECRRKM